MTNCSGSLLLACVLCLPAGTPADGVQLPPPVLLDQLLLRTGRLVEADELDTAVKVMDEVFALGAEHDLQLPPNFRFEHARVAFAVGLVGTAKESVTQYLTVASREAEPYVDAVALLEDVDRILERRDGPECSPLPEGSACWMELTSHPGCYVWNFDPQPDETATWTGECSAGFAKGAGTLTWIDHEGSQEHQASRRYGQPHGESLVRNSVGWVHEGPHRFGKRHGAWIERTADGAVLEGPYVDGEENGHWVERFESGNVAEGTYVDGERDGHWVWRYPDGQVESGPYVDGKQNGHWVERLASGTVQEGPYVDGQEHGRWVVRSPDGVVQRGSFLAGKRHGRWVSEEPSPNARICEIQFVNGQAVGDWDCRSRDGCR